MAGKQSVNKGGFSTPDGPGDRTLDQQLNGLDRLFMEARARRSLTLARRGLISIGLAQGRRDRSARRRDRAGAREGGQQTARRSAGHL